MSMAAYDAMDTSGWSHCWVTFKEQHEDAFKALLNAATEGGQFLYIPVGEVVLSGLSEDQILLLIEGREDLIHLEDLDSVRVLEDLWYAVEEAVMQIAPDATRQGLVAVSLSVSERRMIDKLRAELEKHPTLHYAPIEFGES